MKYPASIPKVVLVGNPNSGKSSLFNQLTFSYQQVGNWAGVTVEQKNGFCKIGNTTVEIVDLPGCYSLVATEQLLSPDESITLEFLETQSIDLMINVVDSTNLQRQLYFTYQLLARFQKVIVVLTMQDCAKKKGIDIDLPALSRSLGAAVYGLNATCEKQTLQFAKEVFDYTFPTPCGSNSSVILTLPKPVENWVKKQAKIGHLESIHSALEGDLVSLNALNVEKNWFLEEKKALEAECGQALDVCFAKARFQAIERVLDAVLRLEVTENTYDWTHKIDTWVLNRLLGVPIFLGVVYVLFTLAIEVGGLMQTQLESLSQFYIFKPILGSYAGPLYPLLEGALLGAQTLLSFLPVLAIMFLGLGFLESSGFSARAAFVVDRLMRFMGLPGQSLVPMIIGFGCNVPAVMGARVLKHRKEQILTVMMSPFMSCGARLCIYALFVSAFFPQGGQNIIFALYVIGIIVAFFTGWCLRKTILPGKGSPWIMELPAYRWPVFRILLKTTWHRLNAFLTKAGILILPLSILLGPLESRLEGIARSLTPFFKPLGITLENWQATMGLLSGAAAKEVVVGTLNRLYATSADNSIYGAMFEKFGSKSAAFAYLLFILLYSPCISVIGAIAKELNIYWAAFSIIWTTSSAYWIATFFYQSAHFWVDPIKAICWFIAGIVYLGAYWLCLKVWAENHYIQGHKRWIPIQLKE